MRSTVASTRFATGSRKRAGARRPKRADIGTRAQSGYERTALRQTRFVTEHAPLHHFLHVWFGLEPGDAEDPAQAVAPIMRFNRPVEDTVDGEVQVLVVEQQGVWLWGMTSEGRFVERENEPGVLWREIDEGADEFWLHHAAFEAATNLVASRSAQMFDAATVARITSAAAPLPCGTWTWPGTIQSMYHHGAAVIMICEDGGDYWVVASAPSETDLVWLDELDLSWDEVDTRLGTDS